MSKKTKMRIADGYFELFGKRFLADEVYRIHGKHIKNPVLAELLDFIETIDLAHFGRSSTDLYLVRWNDSYSLLLACNHFEDAFLPNILEIGCIMLNFYRLLASCGCYAGESSLTGVAIEYLDLFAEKLIISASDVEESIFW